MSGSPAASPRAVTFDFWNTLCHEPPSGVLARRRVAATAAVLAEHGVPCDPERLAAAYDSAWSDYQAAWIANRQYVCADAVGRLLADLGLPGADHGGLQAAVLDAFVPSGAAVPLRLLDGAARLLAALDAVGVRIGIVCDVGFTPSPLLRAHLEGHGVLEHFDHWSFSDEVGVYKPHRRIFEHALEGLGGIEPAEAWHVGDRRRTDVAGAQAMGMTAVRITGGYDDTDATDGPEGDLVVAGHGELHAALGL